MAYIQKQRQFYALLLNNENLFGFLLEHGLIQGKPSRCKNCRRHNTFRLQTSKRTNGNDSSNNIFGDSIEKYSYTCSNRDCRTHYSPRSSTFFDLKNTLGKNTSKLSVSQLFELIYLWCIEEQRCRVIILTQITGKTVTFWFSKLRELCHKMFQKREKLGGVNKIIEIDECLFRGKRKNNRGRYLGMDRWRRAPNIIYAPTHTRVNNGTRNTNSTDRYGNRIFGPWVVGICECSVDEEGNRTLLESRFFIVRRRDKKTLIRLILQEVNHGTTIFTDEWAAYRTLRIYGFNHITINHSKEYVTPEGHHSNTVEVVWHHLKTKILRKMSGVPRILLNSYLQESWLRSTCKNYWEYFRFILKLISIEYPLN